MVSFIAANAQKSCMKAAWKLQKPAPASRRAAATLAEKLIGFDNKAAPAPRKSRPAATLIGE
jgi:hypothetical protein